MSNLVPEPRQDKNGKIVIRHVKVDVHGATINVPIPAPRPVERAQHPDSVKDTLCADLSYSIMEATMDYDTLSDDQDGDNDRARVGIYEHLKTYPEDLIVVLDELHSKDDEKFDHLARFVEQREPASFVSNYIAVGNVVETDFDFRGSVVRALDHYPQLMEYGDIRTAGPEVISKAKSLLMVAEAIHFQAEDDDYAEKFLNRVNHETDFVAAPVIKHESLINFVLENHERASDIARIIKARNIFKPEEIKVVLDHPEAVLSDGAL